MKKININIGNGETKLSICTDGMTVYVENVKRSTKQKLLELISDKIMVAGYKVSIQKSIASYR